MNDHFLDKLREQAFFFKLESKDKYGGGVSATDLLSILKSLTTSYYEFIKVEYERLNSEMVQTRYKKIQETLVQENTLLIVDLKFESCGMSIAPNTLSAFKKVPNIEELKDWKRESFEKYKIDIISSNFNDIKFLNRITEQYNPVERARIFKPLIEGIVNNDNATTMFQFSTQESLHVLKKPVQSSIDILIPQNPVEDRVLEKRTTLAKVEVISGQTRVKPKVLELFSDEISPKYLFEKIIYDDTTYNLRFPLSCDVQIEDGLYILENKQFGIYADGQSLNEAKENFEEDFDFLYHRYKNTPDNNLTQKALSIKTLLQFIVE